MGRINVLDKHMAELIAAGEVVERPCSVIKELIENCIDAKAKSIVVEIKDGGTSFMRVTDDGSGILKEDVKNAFLRNATSKVNDEEDLNKISTLGFRGEALASICAVAKVEVITKAKEDDVGTRYVIEGGEEKFFDDYGCPSGTTIIIRDIFYNVPARLKFLKKNVSEGNAIAAVLDHAALSHSEVSMKFIRDKKQVLSTQGNSDNYSCIYSVYGKEFVETLMPVDYELNGIRVYGFISRPSKSRASRSMQHFFINKRYVKSRTMMAALEEAFKRSIMTGKFPACVMFMEIDFSLVDVNVHPSKTEVRFVDERNVFEAVYYAVQSSILRNDKVSSLVLEEKNESQDVNKNDDQFFDKISDPIKEDKPLEISLSRNEEKVSNEKAENNTVVDAQDEDDTEPEIFIPSRETFVVREDINLDMLQSPPIKTYDENKKSEDITFMSLFGSEKAPQNKFSVVGEAFKTYVIFQDNEDNLLLIDKHAAHERLIYEKLKSRKSEDFAQVLIVPENVTLSKEDYDAIMLNLDLLYKVGFEIDAFGSSIVRVRTIPSYLEVGDIEESIVEMASYLRQNKKDISTSKMDWIYHNVACRSAIKAGSSLSYDEMMRLVEDLKEHKEVRYCPHGRPVFIVIKRKEIEKKFGRIV